MTNITGAHTQDILITSLYSALEAGSAGKPPIVFRSITTDASGDIPVVFITDGYVVNVGDEVVVYVQILNNPGFNGANFGIRYDERLELVSSYEGAFFANTSTEASHAVNCGYNYVWGT